MRPYDSNETTERPSRKKWSLGKRMMLALAAVLVCGFIGSQMEESDGTADARRKAQSDSRREQIEQLISARKISEGMTRAEVRRSWGDPTSVTTTTGEAEVWRYGLHSRLEFESGKVTKISVTR